MTAVVENQGHANGGQSLEIEGQGHEIGGQNLEVKAQGRADVVQGSAKNGVRGLDNVTEEKNFDQIHVSDEEAGHVIVKDGDQGHKKYFPSFGVPVDEVGFKPLESTVTRKKSDS